MPNATGTRRSRARQKWVPFSKIVFNPLNFYGILKKPQLINWLQGAYQRHERFINTPIVSEHPLLDDQYLVICGEGRIRAARDLGNTDKVYCQVHGGMSEDKAMAILAEDNATQATEVIPARATESYYLYIDVLRATRSHKLAAEYISATYASPLHAVYGYAYPGWMLAHSSYMGNLMRQAGPQRERLDEIESERNELINMPLYALRALAQSFWPLSHHDMFSAPEPGDLEAFDTLLACYVDNHMSQLTQQQFQEAIQPTIEDVLVDRAARLREDGERAIRVNGDAPETETLLGNIRRELKRLSRRKHYLGEPARDQVLGELTALEA